MDTRTGRLALALAGALLSVTPVPAPAQAPSPSTSPLNPYSAATARVQHAQDKGIYYGQKTEKGAFPFVVSLIHAEADNDEDGIFVGYFCAGSLIGERWVITAAWCMMRENENKQKVTVDPEQVNIYAGSIEFKDGKRIKVKRVIVHPQFVPDSFDHDIALIELEE